jgi:hypothetical protein
MSFNFTFRYIDDVLSLYNSRFGDFVDRIYHIELEIKDTTNTDTSALCLDLHLESGTDGRLRTKHYDKRDDFNEQIDEKRSTVCTHRYADCLVKNTFTKDNQYVVNHKHEHVDDISFPEHFARSFNFTFRYIDDVFSLNNSRFGDFVDRIYPIELEIKDITDTDRSASYLENRSSWRKPLTCRKSLTNLIT